MEEAATGAPAAEPPKTKPTSAPQTAAQKRQRPSSAMEVRYTKEGVKENVTVVK